MRTRRDLSVILIAASMLVSCTTDVTRRAHLEKIAPELPEPPRPVIIVPGFGLTRLFDPVTRRYVWGTVHNTVQTRYADDLDLPAGGRDRLVPQGYGGSRGPMNSGWHLSRVLTKYGRYTRDRNVYPFYYDWRLTAKENADKLSELADRIRGDGKVDIVTHSAGAIVALTYVKLGRGADAVDHLVLIAPTRRGVVDAFRILVRPERFLRRVFTARIVSTWPSVLELLPEDGRFLVDSNGSPIDFDAWNADSWRRFGRTEPAFAESLARARRFRDELRDASMPPRVRFTVLGSDCFPTATRVLARSDGTFAFYRNELRHNEKWLMADLFEPGDGTVPVSSSSSTGDTLLFCAGHRGIVSDPNVQRALIRILYDQAVEKPTSLKYRSGG